MALLNLAGRTAARILEMNVESYRRRAEQQRNRSSPPLALAGVLRIRKTGPSCSLLTQLNDYTAESVLVQTFLGGGIVALPNRTLEGVGRDNLRRTVVIGADL